MLLGPRLVSLKSSPSGLYTIVVSRLRRLVPLDCVFFTDSEIARA